MTNTANTNLTRSILNLVAHNFDEPVATVAQALDIIEHAASRYERASSIRSCVVDARGCLEDGLPMCAARWILDALGHIPYSGWFGLIHEARAAASAEYRAHERAKRSA